MWWTSNLDISKQFMIRKMITNPYWKNLGQLILNIVINVCLSFPCEPNIQTVFPITQMNRQSK